MYKPRKGSPPGSSSARSTPPATRTSRSRVLLAAGLKGIEEGYELPAGAEDDVWSLTEAERRALGIQPLPQNLGEAIARRWSAASWSPRPSASTSSTSSCATSARSGRSTAAQVTPFELDDTSRCSERARGRWRRLALHAVTGTSARVAVRRRRERAAAASARARSPRRSDAAGAAPARRPRAVGRRPRDSTPCRWPAVDLRCSRWAGSRGGARGAARADALVAALETDEVLRPAVRGARASSRARGPPGAPSRGTGSPCCRRADAGSRAGRAAARRWCDRRRRTGRRPVRRGPALGRAARRRTAAGCCAIAARDLAPATPALDQTVGDAVRPGRRRAGGARSPSPGPSCRPRRRAVPARGRRDGQVRRPRAELRQRRRRDLRRRAARGRRRGGGARARRPGWPRH